MVAGLFKDLQAGFDETEEVCGFLVETEGVEEFDPGLVIEQTTLVIKPVQYLNGLSELRDPDVAHPLLSHGFRADHPRILQSSRTLITITFELSVHSFSLTSLSEVPGQLAGFARDW